VVFVVSIAAGELGPFEVTKEVDTVGAKVTALVPAL
jgi:hypothetical protein